MARRKGQPSLANLVEVTRTTALFPSAVFVQWNIVSDEVGTHLVTVARAGAAEGPWETLADVMPDAYHYLDNHFNLPPSQSLAPHEGLNLFSLSREVYYRISVTPPSGLANTFTSVPVPIEPGLDRRTRLLKRKLLRDLTVGFRNLNGVPLIALKRRRWGTRCLDCWDPVTHEGTEEHCRKCYGTTFEGGYWAPMLIRGRRTPIAVDSQVTAHGDSDVAYVTFTVLDYPHLEYKDLLIDLRRNERFIIQRVARTELKTVTVHQTIAASQIARDAVEYEVLVDPSTTPPLY